MCDRKWKTHYKKLYLAYLTWLCSEEFFHANAAIPICYPLLTLKHTASLDLHFWLKTSSSLGTLQAIIVILDLLKHVNWETIRSSSSPVIDWCPRSHMEFCLYTSTTSNVYFPSRFWNQWGQNSGPCLGLCYIHV